MTVLDISRQAFLFLHLMIFAIAIAEILREDWRLFRSTQVDVAQLTATARTIKYLLISLWTSGVALVWFRTGPEMQALLADPKFHAKILVVCSLTFNGILLHAIAFPLLHGKKPYRRGSVLTVSVLGAISTTSWLFAGFIGTSRIIAPHMSFSIFIGLYELALAAGLAIALIFVQPKLQRLISGAVGPDPSVGNGISASAGERQVGLLRQIETTAQVIAQAQNQLHAIRYTVLKSDDLERTENAGELTHLTTRANQNRLA